MVYSVEQKLLMFNVTKITLECSKVTMKMKLIVPQLALYYENTLLL